VKPVFFVILLFLIIPLAAQELTWDIDSIFDEPYTGETSPEEPRSEDGNAANSNASVLNAIMRRGFTFDASYTFQAGIAPGFSEALWNGPGEISWSPGFKMSAGFAINAQISSNFRIKTSFSFQIPDYNFALSEFFFDYNISDAVFLRGGKYSASWGISPNYGFTNLLARVPDTGDWGEAYMFRADIPIGVGGFQVLALTRANLDSASDISWKQFGFGAKYNLAFTWADFNLGAYYQFAMPFRTFLSVKTTIWDTEIYSEGLFAIDTENPEDVSGAANFGFVRDFFDGKLTVNGEMFFNTEGNTRWYRSETITTEEGPAYLADGLNIAVNLLYRFSGWGSPRLFFNAAWNPVDNSAYILPGVRFTPWSNIEVYLAMSMALGSANGYYYKNTPDPNGRPFSVIFLVSLKGSVTAGYYY
jgi:hypothetical protein